ncbi:MAG: hypothetical protein H6713_23335 [Myxococcales bacterium]|nr:hypothetical protein [Myxococcales bacterium]MCB9752899.1 hypothetical protein [Myxococcales bacterium]
MVDLKSLLKTAESAMRTAGKHAGAAVKTAGTVVGIGVGSMSIQLARGDYSPGDLVRGRLRLELTEPVAAKRLVVGIRATQRYYELERDSRGNQRRVERSREVYKYERELDGARTYTSASFGFELGVPGRREQRMPDGVLGDVATILGALKSSQRAPLQWGVHGFLDIPWKVNLRQRVALNVAG